MLTIDYYIDMWGSMSLCFNSSNLSLVLEAIFEVTGKEILPNDNFFSAGGDSMTAIHVIAELRGRIQQRIDANALFEYPTPILLADAISKSKDIPTNSFIPKSENLVSFQQEQIWLTESLESASKAAHVLVFSIKYLGVAKDESIKFSWDGIINKHAALRDRFYEEQGEIYKSNHPEGGSIKITSIESDDDGWQERVTQELVDSVSSIFSFPLIAAHAVKTLSGGEVFFAVHHAVTDAISIQIIYEDFCQGVEGKSVGFSDRHYYQEFVSEQRSNWTDGSKYNFPDLIPLPKPAQIKGGDGYGERTFVAGVHSRHLGADYSEKVRKFAADTASSVFEVLATAAALTLASAANNPDIVIGVPFANRSSYSSTVGYFANVVPVRFRFGESVNLSQVVNISKQSIRDAWARADAPYLKIVNSISAYRSYDINPVYQFMVGHHKKIKKISGEHNLYEVKRIDFPATLLDLVLEFEETETDFELLWRYDLGKISSNKISELNDFFNSILGRILDSSVYDLKLVSIENPPASKVAEVYDQEDSVQKLITDLWVSHLGREVALGANFFSLGGTSISVIKIVADINSSLGSSISPRDFYKNPTVAGLRDIVVEGLVKRK